MILAFERCIPRRRRRRDIGATEATDQKSAYFFGREDFPDIPIRTFRILISTLGLSLFLTDFFPNATTSLPATPILFSIPILFVLPFILFPIWIYEDTGLRYYDKEAGIISSPGSAIRDQLTGAGVFFT